MLAAERLWLTAGRDRLVREGHKDAATLYAAVGDEIPDSAAAMFGLADGRLGAAPLAAKERKAPDNKERKGGDDKSGPGGGQGGTQPPAPVREPGEGEAGEGGAGTQNAGPAGPPDDLTRIKGIGPMTARKLQVAGITTFAQLAAAGDAEPPLDAIRQPADWLDWVRQAKELALAAPAPATDAAPAPGLTINKLPKKEG